MYGKKNTLFDSEMEFAMIHSPKLSPHLAMEIFMGQYTLPRNATVQFLLSTKYAF